MNAQLKISPFPSQTHRDRNKPVYSKSNEVIHHKWLNSRDSLQEIYT